MNYLSFNSLTVVPESTRQHRERLVSAQNLDGKVYGSSLSRERRVLGKPEKFIGLSGYRSKHSIDISGKLQNDILLTDSVLPDWFRRPSKREKPFRFGPQKKRVYHTVAWEKKLKYLRRLGVRPPMLVPQFLYEINTEKKNFCKRKKYRSMSSRTRLKIKRKIKSWYLTHYYKNGRNEDKIFFSFLTFTVTKPNISDELVYKMWNQFLTAFREKFNNVNYLWVAERQDGKRNGMRGVKKAATNNIHFHVFFDKWRDIQEINSLWVECHELNGLPYQNEEGRRYQPVQLPKNKKGLPIKRINVRLLMAYATKYVVKNDSTLYKQAWNCSRSISALGVGVVKVFNIVSSKLAVMAKEFDFLVSTSTGGKEVAPNVWCFGFKKMSHAIYRCLEPLFLFNLKYLHPV